jgi:hypothetical protein
VGCVVRIASDLVVTTSSTLTALSTLTLPTAALIALVLASFTALSAAATTLAALSTLPTLVALPTLAASTAHFAFAKAFTHFDRAVVISSSIKLLEGLHHITRCSVAPRVLNQLFSVGWIINAA